LTFGSAYLFTLKVFGLFDHSAHTVTNQNDMLVVYSQSPSYTAERFPDRHAYLRFLASPEQSLYALAETFMAPPVLIGILLASMMTILWPNKALQPTACGGG
jgi:hypothetical protein